MMLARAITALSLFGALTLVESGISKKEQRSGGLGMYFKYKDHFERQTETSDDVSLPFTRETYLYSRASRGYVQVIGRRVNANGARTEYARFLVESDNFGRVRFKGIQSGRYLCMNKAGKLITKADRMKKSRKHRNEDRVHARKRSYKIKKMRRCVFKEVYKSAYIAFQFVANDSWYLAMDRKGQPRRGPRTRSSSREIHFIERPIGVKRRKFQLSERSRPKFNRRKMKRKKQASSYQKSERSWPLVPSIINNKVVINYIKRLTTSKRSLKRAISSLRQLRAKVDAAVNDEDAKLRTRKLSTYSTELNNILSGLSKTVGN